MIIMSPLHFETQAGWENLFFPVSIIKLRMVLREKVYISVIGASAEAKTQIISICSFICGLSNFA